MVEALAGSGAERGYPPSIGSAAVPRGRGGLVGPPPGRDRRSRRPGRLRRDQGVRGRDAVLPQAARPPTATPSCTRRSPTPATRWGPPWPDAGPSPCRPRSGRHARPRRHRAPPTPSGRSACGSTRRATRPGGLDDLGAAAAWGRAHGVPVLSDECYVEFTWDGPPRSDPRARHRGRPGRALALQALEPGRRAGRLLRRRPRAGDLPARGAQARRDDGPGPGPGRRGGRLGGRRPRRRAAGPLPAAAGAHGRACWPAAGIAGELPGGRLLPVGAGARRRRLGPHPAPGRGRRRARGSRRVLRWTTTTCASPWCNPTTGWSWWVDDWGGPRDDRVRSVADGANPMDQPQGPSTLGYWLGGLLIAGGIIGGIVWGWVSFSSFLDAIDDFERVPVGEIGTIRARRRGLRRLRRAGWGRGRLALRRRRPHAAGGPGGRRRGRVRALRLGAHLRLRQPRRAGPADLRDRRGGEYDVRVAAVPGPRRRRRRSGHRSRATWWRPSSAASSSPASAIVLGIILLDRHRCPTAQVPPEGLARRVGNGPGGGAAQPGPGTRHRPASPGSAGRAESAAPGGLPATAAPPERRVAGRR